MRSLAVDRDFPEKTFFSLEQFLPLRDKLIRKIIEFRAAQPFHSSFKRGHYIQPKLLSVAFFGPEGMIGAYFFQKYDGESVIIDN